MRKELPGNEPRRVSRRRFLETAAAAAAASTLTSCAGSRSPYGFFTAKEAKTAEAICEQLIPADQDPGAAWAGVANYIDRQLQGPYRDFQASYRAGLAGIDEASAARFGKAFVELGSKEQAEVLAAAEKGEAAGESWKKIAAKDFFNLILDHTCQGFYGDPRHGGNRDFASWKMIGLPYPPVRGRNRYSFPGSEEKRS